MMKTWISKYTSFFGSVCAALSNWALFRWSRPDFKSYDNACSDSCVGNTRSVLLFWWFFWVTKIVVLLYASRFQPTKKLWGNGVSIPWHSELMSQFCQRRCSWSVPTHDLRKARKANCQQRLTVGDVGWDRNVSVLFLQYEKPKVNMVKHGKTWLQQTACSLVIFRIRQAVSINRSPVAAHEDTLLKTGRNNSNSLSRGHKFVDRTAAGQSWQHEFTQNSCKINLF